jgi:hypothetical protein
LLIFKILSLLHPGVQQLGPALACSLHLMKAPKSQMIERIVSHMNSNTPIHRYGWLEHDEGMWHFLTDLFADPGESTRRWPDRMRALEELKNEGWTVVSPYPEEPPSPRQSSERTCGYGLIWNNN